MKSHRGTKTVAVAVIAALLFVGWGVRAFAEEDMNEAISSESMIVDMVFVRPFGLVATVVGTAFFIASLPFSAPGGNTKAAFQKLVAEPAAYTFHRPLGLVEKKGKMF